MKTSFKKNTSVLYGDENPYAVFQHLKLLSRVCKQKQVLLSLALELPECQLYKQHLDNCTVIKTSVELNISLMMA